MGIESHETTKEGLSDSMKPRSQKLENSQGLGIIELGICISLHNLGEVTLINVINIAVLLKIYLDRKWLQDRAGLLISRYDFLETDAELFS